MAWWPAGSLAKSNRKLWRKTIRTWSLSCITRDKDRYAWLLQPRPVLNVLTKTCSTWARRAVLRIMDVKHLSIVVSHPSSTECTFKRTIRAVVARVATIQKRPILLWVSYRITRAPRAFIRVTLRELIRSIKLWFWQPALSFNFWNQTAHCKTQAVPKGSWRKTKVRCGHHQLLWDSQGVIEQLL